MLWRFHDYKPRSQEPTEDVINISTMKPILEFTITAIFVRTLKDEKEGALDFLKKMEGISVGELG